MQNETSSKPQYKALTLLSMIYITIILAADVLIYKISYINPITFSVGSLVTPFWFIISDIISEVYGYEECKKLIWSAIVCGFIFAIVCTLLIHLPAPTGWQYQPAYEQVLGKLFRVFIGSVVGIAVGAFMTTYLVQKWKILTQRKYFWFRAICASATGQLAFTIVTLLYDLIGIISINQISHLILISFSIKLFVAILLVYPATAVAFYLKKLEGIDVYNYNINFNPFKLTAASK